MLDRSARRDQAVWTFDFASSSRHKISRRFKVGPELALTSVGADLRASSPSRFPFRECRRDVYNRGSNRVDPGSDVVDRSSIAPRLHRIRSNPTVS